MPLLFRLLRRRNPLKAGLRLQEAGLEDVHPHGLRHTSQSPKSGSQTARAAEGVVLSLSPGFSCRVGDFVLFFRSAWSIPRSDHPVNTFFFTRQTTANPCYVKRFI